MRTNRFLAVLLAATMVFGSTVTAFAADATEADTGAGTAVEGQGAAEGYVNTSVTKVVLPTTTATTFAFIMDPQEMLKTTNGARLGTAWTQPKNDTYVYFKTANGYANESDTVYFINKSTIKDLDVTVKAVATAATSDPITLGDTTAATHGNTLLADPDDAALYLGLKVGGVTTQITNASTGVTTVVAADKAPNEYTIVYNTKTKKYEYAEKAGSTFQAVPISVLGGVSHAATEAQAPKLTLTWSWAPKAGSGQTAQAASVNYVTNDAYTVTNATLDQTAAAYGSFNGKIGPDKGGKLTINGTASSVITFANDIEKIQYRASSSGTFADVSNGVATFKGKAVTVKGSVWNATGDSAIPVGAQIQVVFKDPDNDNSTNNTPTAIIFEKP
ncbi:hypothetical protein [Butyrivibrio sp. MC2021]|uniref:hypothetical protein n=1 Tax=Butyrivibrio sp. MC2021 TaxID=1408306 RepID=UPI000479B297|nr:hypothetical protein [Butyrivibrio sp. MC2021]